MRKTLTRLYIFLILLFLYAPIGVLMVFSFNESKSRANFTGFSLKWYEQLFSDPEILSALSNTIIIALLSALIATIIGTFAAVGINSFKKRWKQLTLKVNNIPVMNPDIVTGISLMLLFIFFFRIIGRGNRGFLTVLLSHITFNIPYVILAVLPKIRQLDKSLYEAAQDLGATPSYAYQKIIIPEIFPGIISGFMLAFTLSLDDFIVTFFTTGSGVNTLSTLVYSMTKQSINPKINALSTIMFVAVLILLYVINVYDKKEETIDDSKKKKFKLRYAFVPVFVLGILFLFNKNKSSAVPITGEVYFYNWGDYIDPEVITEFTNETGIRVINEYFDSNETLYAKLSFGDGNYDVAIPSEYMFQRMIEENMLEEINMENVPNFDNLSENFKNTKYDPENKYVVPYMWGTLGILYNKEMVDEPVDSWNILWDEKYKGDIFMYDSSRDSMAVALKKLGYSLNTHDEKELEEARNELIKQRPLVQAYIGDTVKEKMIGEEGAFAVVYSGDAMYCMQNNPNLGYVVPKEGSNVWYDAMVILKNSKNKENAEKFINFMSRAEIAAQNSEYIGYSTANSAALDYLPEEMKSNPAYWASDEIFERCDFFDALPADVLKIYDKMWTELFAN